MAYTIERYSPALEKEWNAFVKRSKNGTFLFSRNYMDYHADRFMDYSLIARDAKGRIAAILPADARGDILRSHGGLTYGGWIAGYKGFDIEALLGIQQTANRFLSGNGFRQLIYKPVPFIYSEIPSQEDIYMLFRNNATLTASQVSSAINLATEAGPDADRRRKARGAQKAGIEITPSDNLTAFWKILSEVLHSRHNTAPVHTIDEISLLRQRFPDEIQLYAAMENDTMIAGTLLYISRGVVHAQYIAASPRGRELNALSLLFSELIAFYREAGYRWFDFGTSNEQNGLYLNEGLARQKNTLGGRAVVYNTYSITL